MPTAGAPDAAPVPRNAGPLPPDSESGYALRTLEGNGRPGDLLERAIELDRVADQLRHVGVELVVVGAGRADPVVARAGAEGPVERTESASRNLRTGRIPGDR